MQKIEVLPQTATLKHNETAKPKSKTKPCLFGLCGLIPMMGVGYFAYNQIVIVPQQQAKNKIQTASVERSNLTILVSANGTVQPQQSVNVSPKTSETLKQCLYG